MGMLCFDWREENSLPRKLPEMSPGRWCHHFGMSSIELSPDAAALNEIGKCIVVPPIQQSIKLGNTARGNKYLG